MAFKPPSTLQEFHFLLLPEFSVMGFVSAIEPLRVANRFRPDSYRWRIVSVDGGPVVASNGMSINADTALFAAGRVERLFCAHLRDTPSHFSRAYRARFGQSPKDDRSP